MKGMILAAGLGKRMRPLTEQTPKPLLKIAGRYLIDFHLQNLADAGIREVVINTHWLAEQLPAALGNGDKWGLTIHYSHEPELLETAGGILQALPMLTDGKETFLLVNGDIATGLKLKDWLANVPKLSRDKWLACLAMVDNPEHHPDGDFRLDPVDNKLYPLAEKPELPAFTYSGIGVYHPAFFEGQPAGPGQLGPLLQSRIKAGLVAGSHITDDWLDVGTPERYQILCNKPSI